MADFKPTTADILSISAVATQQKSDDQTITVPARPTFENWEGATAKKYSPRHLDAASSDQNNFYSPLDNVSASPIDTIRSIISPNQTLFKRNSRETETRTPDPTVILSGLKDYFKMNSLTDKSGISFNGISSRARRTISEDYLSSSSFKDNESQLESDNVLRSGPTIQVPDVSFRSDSDSLLNFELERRTVSENVLARPNF